MSRDHSIDCEICGCSYGGFNGPDACDCSGARLLTCLSAVMSTLTRSASAPSEQAIYAEAWALLAEHGRVGVPQEMAEAHREWEGRR